MERDHNGKKYRVIIGKIIDDDAMTEQAYRYPKDIWEEKSAKRHCKSHGGKSFEPASGEDKSSADGWEEEVSMVIDVNSKGRAHCMSLISAGKVDRVSPWTFSPEDGDAILRDNDWSAYGDWHMGLENDEPANSKSHYRYPFGKNGKVYRSALIAMKQRGAAQGADGVVGAADAALKKIDESEAKSADTDVERRTLDFTMSVEERGTSKKKCLRGHAAVFNQETVIGGMFRELILPGAFVQSLQEDDQVALFNHDPNMVLGRKSAGTLDLSEDQRGLAIVIDPDPRITYAQDLIYSVERGDITQMSFAFRIKGKDGAEWEEGEDGLLDLRKIKRAQVFDVSPVTFPAYTGTDVALRAMEEWRSVKAPPPAPTQPPKRNRAALMKKRLALKTKEDF